MLIRGIAIILLVLAFPASAQFAIFQVSSTQATTWGLLKIGGGGFITGLDIASDGTKVARADVYGAYWYNTATTNCGNANATGCWQQIMTMQSMPVADSGIQSWQTSSPGVYEIVVAPSNTQHFYMIYNGYVFSSTNRGGKWTRANGALSQDTTADPNDGNRGFNKKMAVDPQNENVVFASTPTTGVSRTTDGGASWTTIGTGSIAASTSAGYLIAFDPASSVVGGKTQGIYVSSYGHGVYHSTDGGSTWALTSGTPTTHAQMIVDANGNLWLTDASSNLSEFNGTSWSAKSGVNGNAAAVAVDPANLTHVYVSDFSGTMQYSANSGGAWTALTSKTTAAADVPWLAVQEALASNYLSIANQLIFDPNAANTLYAPAGAGIWYTNPPTTNTLVTWNSRTAAIEEMVSTSAVSPNTPGAAIMFGFWDQGVFKGNPNTYPTTNLAGRATGIPAAWGIDWASSAPANIVGLVTQLGPADTSGISTDGGATWTAFASLPTANSVPSRGGGIAASTASNICAMGTDAGAAANHLICTSNGGTSWTQATYSGTAPNASGVTGWGANYFNYIHRIVADRVSANTFYAYNDGSGVAGAAGIWKSTNSGANWSLALLGAFANSTGNAQMRSVPGQAGNFYFTSGVQGGTHPSTNLFYECTDSGSLTCTAVSNVKEVWSMGFGKAKPGNSYPAVFIVGWVNNVYGAWRSDDHCVTWVNIGDGFPLGKFDQVMTVEGDNNTYGTVYVCSTGSSCAYGHLNFLLAHDLNPANDNTPMWINKVA
jgi:hypothetical protein